MLSWSFTIKCSLCQHPEFINGSRALVPNEAWEVLETEKSESIKFRILVKVEET